MTDLYLFAEAIVKEALVSGFGIWLAGFFIVRLALRKGAADRKAALSSRVGAEYDAKLRLLLRRRPPLKKAA
jgi:hypothetical protein